ncbi:HAD-IA family hydrolase [Saccharibacillus sp. CPCC 101409]|uniref:HAD-IA family hydrolase n=1 Tax=Saccharibacillus sp. CPCC 101409 TaxID=3058041 RepID=UPI002672BF28|nr:HAD-IA family hydrolase [Saccharibacillus sp. CPCC 101409]MDO3412217.1 HAD-IA family hydrolase [Saccharibacillus sp. CPCC 101409]
MIRHVIFDFDGTIANSRPLMTELYNGLAEKHGYRPIKDSDSGPFSGQSVRKRCKALGIPLYKLPLLALQVIFTYKRHIKTLEVKDGVRELILELNGRGYTLSIISSNLEGNIRSFLEHNGIDQFTHIRSSRGLFGKHRAIHSFLKENKIAPREALYIGDELRDIEAGRKSGIRIVGAGWGYDSFELMKRSSPDFMAGRPREVFAAIDCFNAGTV